MVDLEEVKDKKFSVVQVIALVADMSRELEDKGHKVASLDMVNYFVTEYIGRAQFLSLCKFLEEDRKTKKDKVI